jgi:hypothetical protein
VTSKPPTAIDIIPATSPKPTSLPPLHVACAAAVAAAVAAVVVAVAAGTACARVQEKGKSPPNKRLLDPLYFLVQSNARYIAAALRQQKEEHQ